jgi:heme a synthase
MIQNFSSWFIRLNWLSLFLIYAVVIAGSFVRITGSGMGCPDWPKCFGQWIPPTSKTQLPNDYQQKFSDKRAKKIEKFSKILTAIGLSETAQKLQADKSLLIEQQFNARKTWTEYINRLAGFLAGNAVMFIFFWTAIRYRKNKKVLIFSFVNLIFIGFQGWFGSIVVATNLVPWTITVHLLFALLIIAIQLYLLKLISTPKVKLTNVHGILKYLVLIVCAITFYQMFLGTQVREYIDALTKQGIGRADWDAKLGFEFLVHRSFSWAVLVLMCVMLYLNFKGPKRPFIYYAFVILGVELTSGVLLAYADMPGLVQISHLFFASILLGILFFGALRLKIPRISTL